MRTRSLPHTGRELKPCFVCEISGSRWFAPHGGRELKRSGNYRREGSGKFAPTRGRELKHPPTGGRFPPHLVAHLTGGQGVVSSSLIEDVSETLADGSPPLGGVSWRGSGTISWGETK